MYQYISIFIKSFNLPGATIKWCNCYFITISIWNCIEFLFLERGGGKGCVCEIKKKISLKLNVESESSLECWEGEIGTNRKLPWGQLTVLVVMRLGRAAFTPESPWVLVGLTLRRRLTQVLGTGQKVKLLIVVYLTSLSYNNKLKKIMIGNHGNSVFIIKSSILHFLSILSCTFPHSTIMQLNDFNNAIINCSLIINNLYF